MRTGFLKKGIKSVGVQRQYSGTAGRIENCQIGVFLTYTTAAGHTLLDRERYLPKSWTSDAARCREADVPKEVRFATKPELAARMLWRTLDAGVQAQWVLGDSVSGSHRALRKGLEERSQAYALAVAWKEKVEVQGRHQRVDQLARSLSNTDWQRLSAGDGSKGPRLFDWAQIEMTGAEPIGWQHGLVVRRSLDQGSKPAEVASFLVFAPAATTLSQMVEALGSRWNVEQCFEEAKGEVGLDEYAGALFSWMVPPHHFFDARSCLSHRFACSEPGRPAHRGDQRGKKPWKPFQSHVPSQTLSDFKRQRGLTYP